MKKSEITEIIELNPDAVFTSETSWNNTFIIKEIVEVAARDRYSKAKVTKVVVQNIYYSADRGAHTIGDSTNTMTLNSVHNCIATSVKVWEAKRASDLSAAIKAAEVRQRNADQMRAMAPEMRTVLEQLGIKNLTSNYDFNHKPVFNISLNATSMATLLDILNAAALEGAAQ